MNMPGAEQAGGTFARIRAARRSVALLAGPESPRAKSLTLGALVILIGVIATITTTAGATAGPPLALTIPIMLGGLLLERPLLRVLVGVVAAAFLAEVIDLGWHAVRPGSAVVLVITAAVAFELVRDRERLGLSTGRGESMLLELRDQLRRQGEMPALPGGWQADVAQRWAGGSTFGGDFLVSTLTDHGKRLELALVDVSGKGLDAGTRALLLSGALGGLLGAVAPERFLAAANDYLVRQEWEEGFATAVHLDLDLRTGEYSVANAGHPAPARYTGGRARWSLLEGSRGPLLGVVANVAFPRQSGRLERGDALLFYSDGVIESRGRDLDDGIDRMLGVASMAVLGAGDVAREVCEASRSGEDDDRAALAVRRL